MLSQYWYKIIHWLLDLCFDSNYNYLEVKKHIAKKKSFNFSYLF